MFKFGDQVIDTHLNKTGRVVHLFRKIWTLSVRGPTMRNGMWYKAHTQFDLVVKFSDNTTGLYTSNGYCGHDASMPYLLKV